MRISKHVNLKELTKSNTALRLGISNEPTDEHLENLKRVCNSVFEPLREYFDCPIGISSGYRSEALNKAVKGSLTSQHCKGEALDIDADIYGQITNKDIFEYIKENLDWDQLIWEFSGAWVHVSFKKIGNRKQILTIK